MIKKGQGYSSCTIGTFLYSGESGRDDLFLQPVSISIMLICVVVSMICSSIAIICVVKKRYVVLLFFYYYNNYFIF
jgi:hypothetical protein